MSRVKSLAIFAGLLATLAVTAAPAGAWFTSLSSSTAGSGKSGPVVLEGGGATLECASADGEWKVQTKGSILEQDTGEKQLKTTQGPHLRVPINKWNGCKAKSSEIKEATPKVAACELQLIQQKGATTATAGVATECKVEVTVLFLTCKITVPPANEQTGLNFNLTTNTLENSGNNLVVTAADEGITTKTAGTCPGISATTNAKEKGVITGQGVNWE